MSKSREDLQARSKNDRMIEFHPCEPFDATPIDGMLWSILQNSPSGHGPFGLRVSICNHR